MPKLNARFADSVKPTTRRADYPDHAVRGLSLRVTPAGVKTWTLRYRNPAGAQRRWSLGQHPVVGLADAREKARDALRQIPDGFDPARQKRDVRAAGTFAELAERYIDEYAKPRKRSWRADSSLLRREVLPHWKHRGIAAIERADVRGLVEGVARKPAPILANRLRALLHRLFGWAIEQDLAENNPVAYVRRPGIERQRDRVLTEDEIRTLWTALNALPREMAAAYKLRLMTAQRGAEVADMRWTDVDLESGWWTIPSERAKNGLAHRVFLAPAALALVRAMRAAVDAGLAAPRTDGKPRVEPVFVLRNARGKRQRANAAATFGIPDFRGHDLRRTAASFMAAGGVSRLVVAKILNHAETGVTAVYDRHSYDAEKQAALTWWDARIAGLLNGGRADVVPFVRRA